MTVTAKPNIRVEKHLVRRSKDLVELIIGRTPMMWTDLHRGHLARMKKCISTDTFVRKVIRKSNASNRVFSPLLFLLSGGSVVAIQEGRTSPRRAWQRPTDS